ncbi:MAG: hypothetical protein ACTSUF_04540 [Candidatus Heimdallarchaeaceae archaeon]
MKTKPSKEKEDKSEKKEETFRSALSAAYSSFEEDLLNAQQQDSEKRQEILQEGIAKIEKKAKKELKSSKFLVHKILEIREKAGMPASIGTAKKIRTPMIFGKDQFQQKLARELLIIGTEELKDIGYAITIGNLIKYFNETRPNWRVRTSDITKVISKLEEAKIIPKRIELGGEQVLIRFKPLSLSSDIQAVLQLATGLPSLSIDKVVSHLDWPVERAQDTLKTMLEMDLAILDEETGKYYFPGIAKIEE